MRLGTAADGVSFQLLGQQLRAEEEDEGVLHGRLGAIEGIDTAMQLLNCGDDEGPGRPFALPLFPGPWLRGCVCHNPSATDGSRASRSSTPNARTKQ